MTPHNFFMFRLRNSCQVNTYSFISLPTAMQMWMWHCNYLYACFKIRVVITKKNFPCPSYHLISWPPETFLIEVKSTNVKRIAYLQLIWDLSKQADILTSVMYCIMQQCLLNFVPLKPWGHTFSHKWDYCFLQRLALNHSLNLAHWTTCSSSHMFQGNRGLIWHWHSTSSAARQRSSLWYERSMYVKNKQTE
jgi:hypothetical protein